MPRSSLKVQQDCINKVKLALSRNGFTSQRALAEDVGFALATVSNFLTGKPVDYNTFEELCRRLGLDWQEISTLDLELAAQTIVTAPVTPESQQIAAIDPVEPATAIDKFSYDPKATPIWELVAKISAQIPDEEWQKLPTDLARRFDDYQQQRQGQD